MKKILKIAGVVLLAIIVLSVIVGSRQEASKGEDNIQKVETTTEAVENEVEAEPQSSREMFTKEKALERVQSHKITKELHTPTIPVGTTIKEVYEIRGKTDYIENLGWVMEETDTLEVYVIGYNELVNDKLDSNPRWEVSKDEIKALNGIAIGITPEFEQ